MKIIKQAFENPFADDFEVLIRHIMCVFLSIETIAFCCLIMLLTLDGDTITLLKFHEESLDDVILHPLMLCAIFIGMTLLSILYKTAYLIYDGLHALLGLIVAVTAIGNEPFILMIILTSRFTAYLIITEMHNSNIKKKQHETQ